MGIAMFTAIAVACCIPLGVRISRHWDSLHLKVGPFPSQYEQSLSVSLITLAPRVHAWNDGRPHPLRVLARQAVLSAVLFVVGVVSFVSRVPVTPLPGAMPGV